MLDTSVLVAPRLSDPASKDAEAALERVAGEDLHAPDFALLEAGNALWKRVRRGELTADTAMTAVGELSRLGLVWHGSIDLAEQALGLALAHGFTTYDAAYVALAARVGGAVLTLDTAMRRKGVKAGLPVVTPADLR